MSWFFDNTNCFISPLPNLQIPFDQTPIYNTNGSKYEKQPSGAQAYMIDWKFFSGGVIGPLVECNYSYW